MNLHSSFRYPFWKYITEEFSGAYFESDFTSLNRLLILYHNWYSFLVKPKDISTFLDSHERGLSEPDGLYWWFRKVKRHRIRRVRRRTAFTLQNNREVFERLLSRKDYASQEAVVETLLRISDWLHTLSPDMVDDKLLDLEGWKQELALLTQQIRVSKGTPKSAARIQTTGHFLEQLADIDNVERLLKFNRLKHILLTERWIVAIGDTDTYRYCKQSKGGRLYIAALYYVLLEKGYIKMTADAPQIAASFNSWLVHDFEQSSFVKAFQAEELSQFDGREGNARTKYLTEVRLLLRDF
ncbi:hypothetical protein [Dyadobacter sp. 22481]|uniref:hypothetical protein n=1 Tax=Dyadobacter sp. 22481 TaxID=3453926 RepID=UPI003F835137